MSKTVALLGTLDTKGAEYAFLKDCIESQGLETLLIDVGVLDEPGIEPDIGRGQVAAAAGADLESLVRIPSVSAPGYDPAEVRRSAESTADLLVAAGFPEVRSLSRGRYVEGLA